MKKCPQCETVYGDEVAFCLTDGTALVEESFPLPSAAGAAAAADAEDEPDTVIRSEPIVIDFGPVNETSPPPPPPPTVNYSPAPPENIVVVPAAADPAATTRNYALFLLVGLLLGGGLVLATLLLSKNLFQAENVNAVRANANEGQPAVRVEPTKTPAATNRNANLSPEPTVEAAGAKHNERNDSFDGSDNGRVIAVNARVRVAPDIHSPVSDVLPMNDRLDIIRREHPNSPWFQVECEHGMTGWMHGDTIEYTR